MIYIKTDSAEAALRRIGETLSDREIKQAQSRAINRSLERARTIARQEVKKVYNISQKYLAGIDISKSNAVSLRGDLHADRKPIPLDAFAPKQETASGNISITRKGKHKTKEFKRLKNNPTAGVSIEVKKGEREIIPYAFMIPGGAVRVFARGAYKSGTDHGFVERHIRVNTSGNDTPIKPLITISEFGSILNVKVLKNIEREVKRIYPDRLEHELQFIIDKAKRAAESV